ncbi:MAG: phosphatidylglycerophosphatase [Rickettsiaceae bacterium]|jgi:phosphatidylglycerophosphatase A|nr:phosphatidylglycerophosphatase [Rickettsiaceae bacterium]
MTEQQPQDIKFYHPAFLISTWFGIGKIPFAPGTWGSLFTFPLFILSHYLLAFASSESTFANLFLLCTTILLIIGTWATNVYMRHTGRHDPKEVVIDEVVGQMLVFFAAFITIAPALGIFEILYGTAESPKTASIADVTALFSNPQVLFPYLLTAMPAYLVCFALFRLFDIWKPWPIRQCDKNIKGGFGVMFDDLFAAMYAVIVLYGIGLLISM